MRTLQSALVALRSQVRRLEGELARSSAEQGGVDGGEEDPLDALLARVRAPRAARAPSVV